MPAQTKRIPHVSDPVTPKVKEKGRRGVKGHDTREDEDVNASGSKVQPPIQRPDGLEVALQSGEPIPREPDEPAPTPNPTVVPIQRPDDPPSSSSFSGKEDHPISREPDDLL